jgi:hypothetical protein
METSHSVHETPDNASDVSGPADHPNVSRACVDCAQLLSQKRRILNKVKTLRSIVGRRRVEARTYRRRSKNK